MSLKLEVEKVLEKIEDKELVKSLVELAGKVEELEKKTAKPPASTEEAKALEDEKKKLVSDVGAFEGKLKSLAEKLGENYKIVEKTVAVLKERIEKIKIPEVKKEKQAEVVAV